MAPKKGSRLVKRSTTTGERMRKQSSTTTRKETTTERSEDKENQQGCGGQAYSPSDSSGSKRNAETADLEEQAGHFTERPTVRSPNSETNYTNESQEIVAPLGSLADTNNDSGGTSKKARTESPDTSIVSRLTGPGGSTPGSLPPRNKTVVLTEMPNPIQRTNTFNMYTQQELTQTQEALENIKKNSAAAIDAGGRKALDDATRILKGCSKNVSTTIRRDGKVWVVFM